VKHDRRNFYVLANRRLKEWLAEELYENTELYGNMGLLNGKYVQ